jgi:hypothetical protein
MGNVTASEKTTGKREKTTHKARKATFLRQEVNGKTVYAPVNKRAHMWATELFATKELTIAQVRKLARKTHLRVYVWTNAGLRKVA